MSQKSKTFLSLSTLLSLVVSIVTCCLLRSWGILEPYELKLLDRFFWVEREQPALEEVVLVTITEEDIEQLEQYPLSDSQLVQILKSIIEAQPRVIGLDIIRNFPVIDKNLSKSENQLAYKQLQTIFRETDNLYGIAKISDTPDFSSITGSSVLKQQGRLTAADLVLDKDGVARRGNLYPDYEQNIPGLGLATALKYLEQEGIYPTNANLAKSQGCPLPPNYPQSGWLQLGSYVLCPLTPNFGGYATHSDSGYQILINWNSSQRNSFSKINLSDIKHGNFDPSLIKDRLVLMGNTSLSSKDRFFTPLSLNTGDTPTQTSGVEILATLASQIIHIARGTTKPISAWKELDEIIWIAIWAACLQLAFWGFFRLKSLFFWLFSLICLALFALSSYYIALYSLIFQGLWLPLLPVWLCLSIQSFFQVFIFFTWKLIRANNTLEIKVKERTFSLQQALVELQNIQQKMIAQEKLNFLGKNVVYISHEIRNPLGVIQLANLISIQSLQNLSAIESSNDDERSTFTQLLDNCHQIDEHLKRINQTIVLLNNQIRADESSTQYCEIPQVIDKSLEITVYSFSIKHQWTVPIQIQTDYASALPQVCLYLSDFERAMCNLIDNSLYSLKQKQVLNPNFSPRLSIDVKQLDKLVQITLEDNGEGIQPKDQARVFEEFYTTKGCQGTGLGLFIVKQIIEGKHGGKLTLETEWGEFTRFTITIPLTKIN